MAHLPVSDSHLHLWDTQRFDYPWMGKVGGLPQMSEPAQLPALATQSTVVVEAGVASGSEWAERDWVYRLSQDYPWIRGFVLAANPADPHYPEQIQRAAVDPFVVGIRYNLEGLGAGEVNVPEIEDFIVKVLDAGLTFDVCIRHQQFPELYRLLRAVRARTTRSYLVLDHLGKPPIADGNLEEWAKQLSKFVKLPGVIGKLSGLPAEADPERSLLEQIVPALKVAMFLFGAERMMIGSDYPVSRVDDSYGAWRSLVRALLTLGFTDAEVETISHRTMCKVYGLGPLKEQE